MRDEFVRERDMGILSGTYCCGNGISHLSRGYGIVPNPTQNRGINPGKIPANALVFVKYVLRDNIIPSTW